MEDICVICGQNDVSDLGAQVCIKCNNVNNSKADIEIKDVIKASIKIAKQLGYNKKIIERLKNVKHENDIYRILKDARLN